MAKRYAIWDKKQTVITPSGAVYTAAQWIEKYPAAALDNITVVCGAGEINGSVFATLGQMVQRYTEMGADFSNAYTDEEKLEVIEAFEDAQNQPDTTPSVEERTAAALEFIALNSLPDAN